MYPKILFPFSPGKSFYSGYTWAMELAARMNAAVFFFTTVPAKEENNSEFLTDVYHSLLEAQGNYLQYASPEYGHARTERHIGHGDFNRSLSGFMEKIKFDIIVIDPLASGLTETSLDYVVGSSNGVIVLPTQPENSFSMPGANADGSGEKSAEAFYNVLHHSDLYRLPDTFFRALGRDKKLFNYLRRFFGKNLHPNL